MILSLFAIVNVMCLLIAVCRCLVRKWEGRVCKRGGRSMSNGISVSVCVCVCAGMQSEKLENVFNLFYISLIYLFLYIILYSLCGFLSEYLQCSKSRKKY